MRRSLAPIPIWLAALLAFAPAAAAHEIRPAFLQIHEVEPNTYDMLWKTPAQGEMRLALNVIEPKDCIKAGEPRSSMVGGAVLQHWRTVCNGGIVGKPIEIENLSHTLTDVIIRYEPLDGSDKTLRVKPDNPVTKIPAAQAWTEVASTYFFLGVEHILLGFDHLMFVLALLLLVRDVHRLIGAITAFTVAHSLTLAGTTFSWIKLASAPVEATIALSIMFVAVEIMRLRAGRSSLTATMPWFASFSFGLLHGFGFAGALRQIGVPEDAAPLALLFFNLGVEAGQLTFIAAVLTIMFLWKRLAPTTLTTRLGDYAWRAPVYVIGITSAFWFIQRTVVVLGL